MNDEEQLVFKKLDHEVGNTTFDCGFPAINEEIEQSFYPTLIKDAYAFEIYTRGILIGYFMLHFRRISLDELPEEVSDYQPEMSGEPVMVTAVHVKYLAIDRKYQGHHLGDAAVRTIIDYIVRSSVKWPIRVITIDARKGLEKWYERLGFKYMIKNRPEQEDITFPMYYDCLNTDEVEKRLEEEENFF